MHFLDSKKSGENSSGKAPISLAGSLFCNLLNLLITTKTAN
jgi:hypothetical protein